MRRDVRLKRAGLTGRQPLDLKPRARLPREAALRFLLVLFREGEVERARAVELDTDAALFAELFGEGRVHLAARAQQLEQLVAAVRLRLRREHSRRR